MKNETTCDVCGVKLIVKDEDFLRQRQKDGRYFHICCPNCYALCTGGRTDVDETMVKDVLIVKGTLKETTEKATEEK